MKKITIGTSGFTYAGGRKGEHLIAQLAKDVDLIDLANFVASGRGWPIPTKGYKWEKMQTFFQGLDIYVCTSLIEGIGYPVLEAMACGIPVVIPQKVGIFDELPDLENVHRYKAGDYQELKEAILEAISRIKENAINQESLVSATARFTSDAWKTDHESVFENFLYGIKELPPVNSFDKKAGIFYVAYGKPALDCVKRAIYSANKYLPNIPICLVSDKDPKFSPSKYIFVKHEDNDIGARSVKTQIYELAPKEWEYVLYLDADTEIVSSDVIRFFEWLNDGWEFIICINPAQYVLTREMSRPDNQDEIQALFEFLGTEEMLQLNGGVFAFRRNERTEKLINTWHTEWHKYGKRDQAALDRSLYNNPVKTYVLGNEWNTITRYLSADITAGILHYPLTARRWRGRIDGRLDSSEAWASVHPES